MSAVPPVLPDTTRISDVFRDDFGGDALDATKWQLTTTGSGMASSVTGSELVITTGTTSLDEVVFRSVRSWKADNIRLRFEARLSQRIANQEFRVRLSNAAGTSYVEWMYDGTTATSQKTQSAQGGKTDTATVTTVTTVTNPQTSSHHIDVKRGTAIWGYRTTNSPTAQMTASTQRDRWFPLPDEDVYLEIRAKNTGAAAGTTTFAVDVVHVQHDNPAGVTIEAGNGDTSAARSIAVYQVGATTTPSPRAATLALSAVITSATTNATGTNWTAYASQACDVLVITNTTGVVIEFRRGATGTAMQVPVNASYRIEGLSNASAIDVRRVDQSNTQVTVLAEAYTY